ncbi:MAG: hypothetical protein ACM308_00455 [Qipengyuania vulgaris]
MTKLLFPLFALATLAACDVASDVAGEAIKGEVRAQYLAQCQSVAEGAGIAGTQIAGACECSADDFEQDFAADGQLEINPARIEEVLQTCVQESGETAPAEG